MPKSVEKEPLLFVDTSFKGCFVQEQSFFKTPTPKPKNIAASNYVHNFDQLSESHFEQLVPSNVTIHEVTKEESFFEPVSLSFKEKKEEIEESFPYETVNIVVDYESQSSSLLFEDEPIDSTDEIPVVEAIAFHEVPASFEEEINEPIDLFSPEESTGETVEDSSNQLVNNEEDFMIADSMVNSYDDFNVELSEELVSFSSLDTSESPLIHENEEDNSLDVVSSVEVDEKHEEVLSFIRDLTHRPSMMRAPIVQIVKQDGSLKSGMIELVDEWHISIDDLMNEVEVIPLSEIEGIRILHL
ncbi:hypothetical protein [Turicibacter sp. TJ11]|uniref:hypothetical protein n=1 Tax=Turicibacter sp. TJ11 TaxID=2806443 RepID=UPI001F29B30B|nr:hypothetical protein [Turicibacter sp. TJ11]